ncbi:unnamed protein product [Didymodactylos carnosus]|uniref:Uncharacterized protein n=1 Tax=Didymodactylos carnosus TaxID=1234261 RepID=A0A814P423_9BILA|nr:unnamed protein product [Didymodactylos carnosus]CAF3865446.1 unnamed protein product [Didymodactylos carnosus]
MSTNDNAIICEIVSQIGDIPKLPKKSNERLDDLLQIALSKPKSNLKILEQLICKVCHARKQNINAYPFLQGIQSLLKSQLKEHESMLSVERESYDEEECCCSTLKSDLFSCRAINENYKSCRCCRRQNNTVSIKTVNLGRQVNEMMNAHTQNLPHLSNGKETKATVNQFLKFGAEADNDQDRRDEIRQTPDKFEKVEKTAIVHQQDIFGKRAGDFPQSGFGPRYEMSDRGSGDLRQVQQRISKQQRANSPINEATYDKSHTGIRQEALRSAGQNYEFGSFRSNQKLDPHGLRANRTFTFDNGSGVPRPSSVCLGSKGTDDYRNERSPIAHWNNFQQAQLQYRLNSVKPSRSIIRPNRDGMDESVKEAKGSKREISYQYNEMGARELVNRVRTEISNLIDQQQHLSSHNQPQNQNQYSDEDESSVNSEEEKENKFSSTTKKNKRKSLKAKKRHRNKDSRKKKKKDSKEKKIKKSIKLTRTEDHKKKPETTALSLSNEEAMTDTFAGGTQEILKKGVSTLSNETLAEIPTLLDEKVPDAPLSQTVVYTQHAVDCNCCCNFLHYTVRKLMRESEQMKLFAKNALQAGMDPKKMKPSDGCTGIAIPLYGCVINDEGINKLYSSEVTMTTITQQELRGDLVKGKWNKSKTDEKQIVLQSIQTNRGEIKIKLDLDSFGLAPFFSEQYEQFVKAQPNSGFINDLKQKYNQQKHIFSGPHYC